MDSLPAELPGKPELHRRSSLFIWFTYGSVYLLILNFLGYRFVCPHTQYLLNGYNYAFPSWRDYYGPIQFCDLSQRLIHKNKMNTQPGSWVSRLHAWSASLVITKQSKTYKWHLWLHESICQHSLCSGTDADLQTTKETHDTVPRCQQLVILERRRDLHRTQS